MAREIRITIDDDEVFERMKRVKQELDLSWKEVLHRGLQVDDFPGPDPGMGARHGRSRGPEPGHPDEELGDRLERQIKQRVEDSLQRAFGLEEGQRPHGHREGQGYEDEVDSLSDAEDAVLVFPYLDDDPAYEVPLRVEIEMHAEGIDIEVVAVRQGKSVTGMNSFDRGARKGIAEGMAAGTPAGLELGDGAETYEVSPVLTWSSSGGDPVVDDVEIEEVLFDE